jgi:beta-phosphoglucomutase
MALKAVLFDFDGVLADTENHHIAAWQRTLAALGWQITDEVAARSAEVDDEVFAAELFAKRGIPSAAVDDWVRKKQQLTVQLMASAPRVYPGAVELVRALEGRVRLAVVANTWRENVKAVLDAAGIAGAFETVIAKDDAAVAKSDLGPYLRALKRLRLAARSAAALEDSPAGLTSARAAGLRTIAVGHRRAHGDWVGDAPFVVSLNPIERVLEHLGS